MRCVLVASSLGWRRTFVFKPPSWICKKVGIGVGRRRGKLFIGNSILSIAIQLSSDLDYQIRPYGASNVD